MAQVARGVMVDSQEVSNYVIDECLLQDVAQQMWEKEVVAKKMQPFITQDAMDYSTNMYMVAADKRFDDGMATPKSKVPPGASSANLSLP